MSLGSCLVTNEIPGSAEAFIDARIKGKSWQQIADEFDLPNPSAARKAFQKATGIADFKIKGQALQDLVNQGPNALKAVNAAKEAAKKVKGLDDVVPDKPFWQEVPDLSKHKFDWPEPETPNIKNILHQQYGYTDNDFDDILNNYLHAVNKQDVAAEWGIKGDDMNKLLDVWEAEGKLVPQATANIKDVLKTKHGYDDKDIGVMYKEWKEGVSDVKDLWSLSDNQWDDLVDLWKAEGKLIPAPPKPLVPDLEVIKAHLSHKYGYTDESFEQMHKMWLDGKATLDITDVFKDLDLAEVKTLFKLWDEENLLKKQAYKPPPEMDFSKLGEVKETLAKQYLDDPAWSGTPIDEIEDFINGAINDIQKGKMSTAQIAEVNSVTKADIDAIKAALKWDDLKGAVDNLDDMNPQILQQLHADLIKFRDDQFFALQIEKSKAKKVYLKYLDDHEGLPSYSDAAVSKLSDAHKAAIKALNDFTEGGAKTLDGYIDEVAQAIKGKPAAVPDIPTNQPVKNKFISDVNLQQKTGLTQSQIDEILQMNSKGEGYLAIKTKLNIEFEQIDDVVWNDLLKKHDGFTWNAYVEKPTSESGFEAVKAKVFESRGKGLTVDEIASKPGAPPKPVIQAILDDKWLLPSPGTKVPIIPPPPPPPPQTWGGTFPSSGTNFKRHSDQEMLDWIGPDTSLLSSAQRSAVSNYTNSGYHDINSYLRGGGVGNTSGYGYSSSNVTKLVKDIDATMRPIPVDVTLTRNFNGIQYLPSSPEDMVGKVMWDDAFLSTSVRTDGVFSGDVQLIINAPQGSMGRYVNDISIHSSEQEMLLARGTRMVVTKVEKHPTSYGGDRWKLFVDVIQ